MKSKTTLILCAALLSAAIAATAMTASTLAQTRTVGVQAGEWYKYGNITVTWTSNDTAATPDPYLDELNRTQWFNMSITSITGKNVTLSYKSHLTNGTDITETDYLDIETGNTTESAPMIISKGLAINDTLYTEGEFADWKINETASRTYPATSKQTHHVNITAATGPIHYYWDNQTGVLVECSQNYTELVDGFNTTWYFTFKLVDSSVWVVPEFNALATILAALTATTAAAVIGKRKLGKKQAL